MFYRQSNSSLVFLEISALEIEKRLKISRKTRKRYCQIARTVAPKLGFAHGQTYFTLSQVAALEIIQKWASARMLRYFIQSCNKNGFPYESLWFDR